MAYKKKADEGFKGEILEFIAPIKESNTTNWCKGIAKIIWGDNPPTIDIRKMNPLENKFGGGISLSDEEANTLTNVLLDNDYGDYDNIKNALERKKKRFTVVKDDEAAM